MNNPVFDTENWREIGATLAQNKTRTFLTAFGIFWGTAILALLLGGAKGIRNFLTRQFDGFATNVAMVSPNRTTKAYKGFNKGQPVSITSADLDIIRRAIPSLDALSATTTLGVTATFADKSTSTVLNGVGNEYSRIFTPVIYAGRFLNATDDFSGRKMCVIGKRVSSELFGVGDPLGKEICINGIYYKVVGVAGQVSEGISIGARIDEAILIPEQLMRRTYNLGESVDMFLFTVKPGYSPSQYESIIRKIVSARHPVAPDDEGAIWFYDVSENFAMVENVFTGINLLALFVGLGTLLSGVIGVGNIMWIIVRERTQEIGIRRAIGAKPFDIIIQILCESIVLTISAGIAGVLFAIIILGAAEHILNISFQITFNQAIGILVAFVFLGSAAGLLPALKSMKIKPVEALNSK